MQRRYLVYKVTNRFNSKIYIGCHSTLNKDDRYMGSGVEIKEAIKNEGRKSFVKEILFEFDNKEEMLSKEKELVTKEFCMREDTYNRIEGGGTYLTEGMVTVKDNEGNTSKVYCDDPRYLSGELVGITKGSKRNSTQHKINYNLSTYKDSDGNIYHLRIDDPKVLSGEVVGINKGIYQKQFDWTGRKHKEETKEKIGKANSFHQQGNKNSSFGTCWVTNEKENKKIKIEDLLSYVNEGWIKGRKMKFNYQE